MKKLTKQEAIENHRKMWNWIADETERQTMIVGQGRYFDTFGIEDVPESACYCCEYNRQCSEELENQYRCDFCPVDWGENRSTCSNLYNEQGRLVGDGLFEHWRCTTDWSEAAELAREIANLPER